jgi:hypothetical protein
MHTQEQLSDLHAQHAGWQQKIRQYRNELAALNQQLDEVVLNKPPQDLMAAIEHFQNQFTVQSEVLDIMRHDFKQHENAIEAEQAGRNKSGGALAGNHRKHEDRLLQFEKLFAELKDEFGEFLQKDLAKPY